MGEKQKDGRKSLLEMSGDFLREAAVLISVFPVLDRVIREQRITGRFALEVFGLSAGLFAMGIAAERMRKP